MPILTEANCPAGVQQVAISTLARIGYQNASSAIGLFTEHENVSIRLFAYRALAQFGKPVDIQFLFFSLKSQNFVVRQDACRALAAVEGEDAEPVLKSVAERDNNESVRSAAQIGLLERSIRKRPAAEKLEILKTALGNAERRTETWIIRTIVEECGPAGRGYIRGLARRDDRIGERAASFLIAEEGIVSTTPQIEESADEDLGILHASTPTHQTIMEKAAGLAAPPVLTGIQQIRLEEGAVDEDKHVALETIERSKAHFYNPLTGEGLPLCDTSLHRAYTIWNELMTPFFEQGYLEAQESEIPPQWGGAWQQLGRVSHLLQDMSSPLHVLGIAHPFTCEFENYWGGADQALRDIIDRSGEGPLHSGAPFQLKRRQSSMLSPQSGSNTITTTVALKKATMM